LAEHLLHDYHKQLPGGITLVPSSGGVFEVTLDDRILFSKKQTGRFPEEGELDKAMNGEA
jgi:selenoprotein W-related protein